MHIFSNGLSISVMPHTVGQFTGLYGCKPFQNPYVDKAEQEAYYGDIIQYQDTEGEVYVKELSWSDELQCTIVGNVYPYSDLHKSGYIQPSKLAFVILGNIYDNPELLDGVFETPQY